MRRKIIWFLAVVILVGVGYFGYVRFVLPRYIARIIVNDELAPGFLPNRYGKIFVKSKKQINVGADSVLRIMHREKISLAQLLHAIDEVNEDEAYQFLDELNSTAITSSNQVFDIGKKYFKPDFDVELFREVFRKRFSVSQLKRGLLLANEHREEGDMSPEILRTIAKQILIEKERKIFEELSYVNK